MLSDACKQHYSRVNHMDEGRRIIIGSDARISIRSMRDVSDVISVCYGAEGLILTEGELSQEFFDLRSGLAGELFQKLINYGLRAAIVLPDIEAYGTRFSELVYEHSSHNMIRVARSMEEAKDWLDS
jgi:Domain of unknown function (DUF4180)